MGKKSKIEWTDATYNPWWGCHKVSEGCRHCYAETMSKRTGRPFNKLWMTKQMYAPLKWKEPCRVFVNSMSDFFHPDADPWRKYAWDCIRKAWWHTFLILTKRPELIKDRLPGDWPMSHVWLGVTAENQKMADKRIPILLEIPVRIRFVSIEPMLSPISIPAFRGPLICGGHIKKVDWIICGAESGKNARPMMESWVRKVRNQCVEWNILFFYKQKILKGKKISTPLLDGKRWTQFPKP